MTLKLTNLRVTIVINFLQLVQLVLLVREFQIYLVIHSQECGNSQLIL